MHISSAGDLSKGKDGDLVKVAGLVLVRQRPGTASGICFITMEDETGCANVVVFENIFDKYRKEILQAKLLMVQGKLQIEGEVIHVIVESCHNLSKLLRHLVTGRHDEKPSLPVGSTANAREISFPGARNFR